VSKIVTYFTRNGAKMFDVKQALRDSGWGIDIEDLEDTADLALVSRFDPEHRVIVSSVRYDNIMNMWFVDYETDGWQCLDNAIEQFKLLTTEET
jgi:hypothetical protein